MLNRVISRSESNLAGDRFHSLGKSPKFGASSSTIYDLSCLTFSWRQILLFRDNQNTDQTLIDLDPAGREIPFRAERFQDELDQARLALSSQFEAPRLDAIDTLVKRVQPLLGKNRVVIAVIVCGSRGHSGGFSRERHIRCLCQRLEEDGAPYARTRARVNFANQGLCRHVVTLRRRR